MIENFALAQEAVNGVRGVRSQRNIAPKEVLKLHIKGAGFPVAVIPVVEKLANAEVSIVDAFGSQGVGFMVRTIEMQVEMEGLINVEEELDKAQKELEHQEKFLAGVRAKLSNERFVNNAPAAVVEVERKKEADSLSKIESLKAKIDALKNN